MSNYKIIKIDNENGVIGRNLLDTSGQTVTFSGITLSNGNVLTGVDSFITGATMNGNVLELSRNQGLAALTTDLTQFNNYTTGSTVNGNTLIFNRSDMLSAYTVDLSNLSNLPTDEQFQLFGNLASTGLVNGGIMSKNVGPLSATTFDISDGSGWVVDNYTDGDNPSAIYVSWSNLTAQTLTNLTGQSGSYIGIDGSGNTFQSSEPLTQSEKRDYISLGFIAHAGGVVLNTLNEPTLAYDMGLQLDDLIDSLGMMNISGNKYSPNGNNLSIDKSSGYIFKEGINYENDRTSPHIKTLSSGSTIGFRYALSVPNPISFTLRTEVDPDIYEDNGVISTTTTNKFTAQRIYMSSIGTALIQLGQTEYDSIDDAKANIATEDFSKLPALEADTLLRGILIVKQGTTDLSDPLKAEFLNISRFGYVEETNFGQVFETAIINHGNTGLRTGGELSPTVLAGTGTTFDITAGSGLIIDNDTNPNNPNLTEITWDNMTGITVDNLGSQDLTWVYIDISGTPQQQNTEFTESDSRTKIILGRVVHFNNVTVLSTANTPVPITDPGLNTHDLAQAIGAINVSGNVFSPQGGNLKVDKTSGTTFRFGSNKYNDDRTPHLTSNSSLSGATFLPIYRDGSGGYTLQSLTTDVNPSEYDDGSGTLQSVAAGSWSIQRIFYFASSNTAVLAYGQNLYSSFSNAKAALTTDSFEVVGPVQGSSIRAAIICRGNASDLSDDANNIFVEGGKFGEFTGGAGGVGNTDLQGAYNNSTTPEITTNVPLGALTLVRGSASDSDNVLEIQNAAQTTNAFIRGDGNSSFKNVSGTTFYGDGSNLTGIVHTTDNYVSGGTYYSGSQTIEFSGTSSNQSFSVDVSPLIDDTNSYVTGQTLNGTILETSRNGGLTTLVTELSGLTSDGINLGGASNVFNSLNGTVLEFNTITGTTNGKITTDVVSNQVQIDIDEPQMTLWPLVVTGNKLISGGASFLSGLDFSVSPLEYIIGSTIYNTSGQTVTLTSGDTSFDRIDVIYADSDSLVGVITGVPSANPVKPEISSLQVEVTFVTVSAGASSPEVTITKVYDEADGVGGGEWDITASDNSVILTGSTNDAFSGTKSVELVGADVGDSFTFNNPTPYDTSSDNILSFYVKNITTWGSKRGIQVSFQDSGSTTLSTNTVILDSPNFGFDDTDSTTEWQIVSISLGDFGLSNNVVSKIKFEVVAVASGGGSQDIDCYIDLIRFQEGAPTVSPQNLWLSIKADDNNLAIAQNSSDQLVLAGGTNLSTSISSKTVTFDVDQNPTFTNVLATGNISGNTFYGDGSNLTGISTVDNYVSGATMNVDTLELTRTGGLSDVTVDLSQFNDESNTASNVGVGQGVFSGKSGVDLQFYSLSGGTNVNLTLNNDTLVIDSTSSPLTVEEIDGTPSVNNVDTIRFSNGTVTDDGGGQVTVVISGGTSGGLGDETKIFSWFMNVT